MQIFKVTFVFLLLLNASIIYSQTIEECATVIPDGVTLEQAQSQGDLILYKPTTNRDIRLALHIVTYSNGMGAIPQELIDEKIQSLNNIMYQAGMQFYEYKRDTIKSDYFSSLIGDYMPKANELRRINKVNGSINIYFVPEAAFAGISSYSSRIKHPSLQYEDGIIVLDSSHHTSLAHEIGHYFDLFHTYETLFGIENIDRDDYCANWNRAGDLLYSTPADIQVDGITPQCIFVNLKNYTDPCGDSNYIPLTDNMMTTQQKSCRENFTEEQINRMTETLVKFRSELLKNSIYLENKIGNINAGGSLHINTQNYNSGSYAFIDDGTYKIGTNNERFVNFQGTGFNYKNINWNKINNDFVLSKNLTVTGDVDRIAHFDKMNYAKIEARLEGQLIQNQGVFEFKDPWYVKSDGTQPNTWIPYVTSYEPTGKETASEKGVFLNQDPLLNNIYYSVKGFESQSIYLNNTGKNHNFFFSFWNGINADIISDTSLVTPIVFKNTNALVQANYKGHFLSNNASAFTNNNQKKLIRANDGKYWLVYESMGKLWATSSKTTDFSGEWEVDELLFNGFSGGEFRNIYISENPAPSSLPCYTFEYLKDGVSYIYAGSELGTTPELMAVTTNFGSAKPVILHLNNELIVMYKKSNSDGYYYRNKYPLTANWGPEYLVSGTTSGSINLAIAGNKDLNNLNIVFEESNKIKYIFSQSMGIDKIRRF